MGRAINWEEEWGQEEMSVGELGRRIMAEEWLMNEEALIKLRTLTGRKLCGDRPESSNEYRMQSSFRYLELYSEQQSVKTTRKLGRGGDASDHNLKLGEAWVRAKYKCVAKKVKPVALSDGSTQNRGLNCSKRLIEREIEPPSLWDEWFIPKFSRGRHSD